MSKYVLMTWAGFLKRLGEGGYKDGTSARRALRKIKSLTPLRIERGYKLIAERFPHSPYSPRKPTYAEEMNTEKASSRRPTKTFRFTITTTTTIEGEY